MEAEASPQWFYQFPSPDTLKDYQEEWDYYNKMHPYKAPEDSSIAATAIKATKGVREALNGLVAFRDELYGYNDPNAKEPHLKLKPVEDMKFFPDFGDTPSGGFAMNANPPDMSIGSPREERVVVYHKRKKARKVKKCRRYVEADDNYAHKRVLDEPEKKFDAFHIPPELKWMF